MDKCNDDDDVISVSSDSSSGVNHKDEFEEEVSYLLNSQELDKDVETLLSEIGVIILIF